MIVADGDGLVKSPAMLFGAGDRSMQTAQYTAFGFLIACMIWAAAMVLKPNGVKPRVNGDGSGGRV